MCQFHQPIDAKKKNASEQGVDAILFHHQNGAQLYKKIWLEVTPYLYTLRSMLCTRNISMIKSTGTKAAIKMLMKLTPEKTIFSFIPG